MLHQDPCLPQQSTNFLWLRATGGGGTCGRRKIGRIWGGVKRGHSPQTPWAGAQPSCSQWLPEAGHKPPGSSARGLPDAVNRVRHDQCRAQGWSQASWIPGHCSQLCTAQASPGEAPLLTRSPAYPPNAPPSVQTIRKSSQAW